MGTSRCGSDSEGTAPQTPKSQWASPLGQHPGEMLAQPNHLLLSARTWDWTGPVPGKGLLKVKSTLHEIDDALANRF